jgi:hypothetical protein
VSVKVMAIVWEWALPSTEKLVLLKVADCANDAGGNAYPSLATIATTCGLTRRGAQKVLDRLLDRGCIGVQTDHSSRRPTTYRVLLDWTAGGEPRSPLEANHVHPRGEPRSPLEANHVHPRGEPRSPPASNHSHTTREAVRTTFASRGERRSPDPSDNRQRTRAARARRPTAAPARRAADADRRRLPRGLRAALGDLPAAGRARPGAASVAGAEPGA